MGRKTNEGSTISMMPLLLSMRLCNSAALHKRSDHVSLLKFCQVRAVVFVKFESETPNQ